jgi:hypothetical protein
VAEEGVLQRVQFAVLGQALDGDDAAAFDAGDGDQARTDLAAVEQHRAGAAIAGVAADLGAGETERVTQHVGEALHGVGLELDGAAVQGELDAFGGRPHAAMVRRSSVRTAWRR